MADPPLWVVKPLGPRLKVLMWGNGSHFKLQNGRPRCLEAGVLLTPGRDMHGYNTSSKASAAYPEEMSNPR